MEKDNKVMTNEDAAQVRSLDEVFAGEGDVTAAFMNELGMIKTADFGKKLDGLKETLEITADYHTMEDGQIERYLFAGKTVFHTVDNQNEKIELPACKLIDRNKKTLITAASIIVNSTAPLPLFTPVEIARIGKPEGKRYVNYKIVVLTAK